MPKPLSRPPSMWRTATLRRSRTLRSQVNQSRVKLFGATLQLTWEPMTSHGAFSTWLPTCPTSATASTTTHYYPLLPLEIQPQNVQPPLQLVHLVQLVMLVALPAPENSAGGPGSMATSSTSSTSSAASAASAACSAASSGLNGAAKFRPNMEVRSAMCVRQIWHAMCGIP